MRKVPGSKTASGVIQWLINQIPPHQWLIESFGGNATLAQQITPPERCTVIEKNPDTATELQSSLTAEVRNQDAFEFIEQHLDHPDTKSSFLYADPPYVHAARRQQKLYQHELTDADHERLCRLLKRWPGMVLLSGYDNEIYRRLLPGWRTAEFRTMTHTGLRLEKIWMNFPEPKRLHDYRFLGKDRTDRQRIRRKIERTKARLAELPPLERHAIIDELLSARLSA
tara:strand:+ start:687 stop:1364 length:678 start_codon:yes stop_codon:yes gene_type:complete